jgi:transketolase
MNKDRIEALLRFSYKNKTTHIASALSQLDFIYELFTKKLVVPYRDKIILGKAFGSQSMLMAWKETGYLDNIDTYGFARHGDIPFVDFSEYTLGNAMGVACGVAMAAPDKLVWCHISDGALQMGNTLEAIQFIGHNNIKNVLVTVDYNGGQVTGDLNKILTVEPVVDLFKGYGWDVYDSNLTHFNVGDKPKVFIMRTRKGQGVPSIEKDIRKWHYKSIESYEELQSLVAELRAT